MRKLDKEVDPLLMNIFYLVALIIIGFSIKDYGSPYLLGLWTGLIVATVYFLTRQD